MVHSQKHQKSQENGRVSVGQLIERLSHFDGPPGQFLVNLLAVQCFLAKAEAGAILRAGKAKSADVLAVYPQLEENALAPMWLSQAIAFAAESTTAATVIKPLYETQELYGQPAQRYLVMIRLKMTGVEQAAAAFLIETGQPSVLEASTERLELTASLLSLYEMRLIMQNQQFDLARMQTAMELLSSLNQQEKFTSAAMTLCNETAARWQCQRVSVGLLKGRYVQVKAISHTEHFSRKMKVVQDIESTMEECLDQDIEILYPVSADAAYVSRAAERLSKRYGPMIVLSLPLRRNGQVLAVLSLERDAEKPFTLDQIETIRLCCQLSTSRLLDLYQSNRWIGAQIASALQNNLSSLARPKHTWAKIAAVVILAALVFLLFAEGRFKAQSTFVFEATQRQFIPAPFDGYIKSSAVLVGDMVNADETVLAQLEAAELRMKLAAAKADKLGYLKQASAAMRDGNTSKAQIAQADADKAQARIELLEYQISRAQIKSPISGIVVEGQLNRQIGAPVKTGDALFEIASLESLRAQLMVPEDQIANIQLGQKGTLATVSYPSRKIAFVVERINPMAELVNERNVFKVQVKLTQMYPWMRPGMEGVAKISVGKRSYAWIWTRKFVNWMRMKFWF